MSDVAYFRDPALPIFEIKSCRQGVHASKQHAHEEYAVGLISSGASHVRSGGKTFTVNRDTLVLIPADVIHQCDPIAVEEWAFEMLFLKTVWMRSSFNLFENHPVMRVETINPSIRQRLQSLLRLLRTNSSSMEKESMIITTLYRYFSSQNSPPSKLQGSVTVSDPIRKIQDFISHYYLEEITLDKLAEVSGLSKYHLIRDFKKAYKLPPHAYQTVLRVNFAKEALKKRQDSIAAVAQNAGFFDESHFIKVFKQYAGTTPAQYRMGE